MTIKNKALPLIQQFKHVNKMTKSEIFKKAWQLVKTRGYNLSNALRTVWQYARNKSAEAKRPFNYKGDAERIFSSPIRKHTGLAALQDTLNRRLA